MDTYTTTFINFIPHKVTNKFGYVFMYTHTITDLTDWPIHMFIHDDNGSYS